MDLQVNKEYVGLVNDVILVSTFQIVAHLLQMYVANSMDNFMNETFVQGLVFTLLGFAAYHLVIKKAVKITAEAFM